MVKEGGNLDLPAVCPADSAVCVFGGQGHMLRVWADGVGQDIHDEWGSGVQDGGDVYSGGAGYILYQGATGVSTFDHRHVLL